MYQALTFNSSRSFMSNLRLYSAERRGSPRKIERVRTFSLKAYSYEYPYRQNFRMRFEYGKPLREVTFRLLRCHYCGKALSKGSVMATDRFHLGNLGPVIFTHMNDASEFRFASFLRLGNLNLKICTPSGPKMGSSPDRTRVLSP